jgi:serine/threonine protein kinase
MTPEQRNKLTDLLVQWEDLYRQGHDTTVDVLCKDDPELAETLARHIAALKRVAWLDKKLEDDDDDPYPPPSDPRPPKVLAGRYRLDELIATGGFAEVWRAFDLELQRIIAVKIPKRTVIGSADAFLAEARRVARLKHPAILPVYDVGVEDGDCFFVSEYVEGGSLADRLVKGCIPAEQACRWMASIADALDHAHRAGVIHRDVKPANILIDGHDRALLADFGIAQSSMKTGEFAPSLGTLRYMSPEQLNGQSAVPQSDIYSLGVVLHEALTGKPPYSSGEPNTLRMEINSGASVSRDLAQRLVPACRKALHKDPLQRFASAAEFATALRTSPKPKARLLPLGAVAAVCSLAFVALRPAPKTGTVLKQSSPSEKASALTPPSDRMIWVPVKANGEHRFAYDASRQVWVEYTSKGNVAFYFEPVAVTDEYVEVLDRSRNFAMRFYDDGCEYSTSSNFETDRYKLFAGRWATSSFGALPPRYYNRFTLVIGSQPFRRYIQAIAEATGLPASIDTDAFQQIGVDPDQVLDMPANNETVASFLDRLLIAVDPQKRLTIVHTKHADGSKTASITAKPGM